MLSSKRALALAAALVVSSSALVATAADASAAAITGDYVAGGTYIRSGPHTGSTPLGLGYKGQGATFLCWTTGTGVHVPGGGTSYEWVKNRDQRTGVTGYSSDVYLIEHSSIANLKEC